MERNNLNNSDPDERFDFRELYLFSWQNKLKIAIPTLLATFIGIVISINTPDIYRSKVLLTSNLDQDRSSLANSLSGLRGITALTGINIPADESTKITEGIEILKSHRFFKELILADEDMLVSVMAAKGWNRNNNDLIIDPNLYDKKNNKWIRKPKDFYGVIPSSTEAHKKFSEEFFSVYQDKNTGLIVLTIDFYSPYLAKEWADNIVKKINEISKNEEVRRAELSNEYLADQINNTNLSEIRVVLSELIQNQIQTIALAKASPEFLFKTLDPAFVPEEKFKPQRLLIIITASLLGLFLGLIITFTYFLVLPGRKY